MTTRKQFLARLKELGAELDETMERECDELLIDAPRGYVFEANSASIICIPFANRGGQSWKPQAYAEAMDDLKHGVRPMTAAERERYEWEADDNLNDVPGIVALPNKLKGDANA